MYRRYATVELYRYILERLKEEGKPVIVPEKDDVLPFRDVYGLLYLRIKTEGTTLDYGKYKMVTVDEMQDYFPIQYAVINHLFNCPKTILGDLNQIVDPYMNIGSLENMQKLLGEHEFRRLTTSYRSSKEITEFANRLVTEKVNPIDRHEEPPEIVKCGSFDEEAKEIDREIDRAYQEKGYGSLAIIARNKSQAQRLADKLRNKVTVLLDTDRAYRGGTVITTALIVKGFEFDEVIVLDADEENYSTESEKRILYVTVTRALHSVKFYHVGELSHFLK
jgi:DNA helicase-2/ATP-dependent DNA helicase PcrA